MNARTGIAAFVICVACAHAGAETYIWTGGGDNGLWSNPLNWADGFVPVSSVDSVLDFRLAGSYAHHTQDLSTDFDIGTIIGDPFDYTSFIYLNGGNLRIHQAAIDVDLVSFPNGPSITVGNPVLTHTWVQPDWDGGSPRDGSSLDNVVLDGSIAVNGGWVIDFSGGTGAIHLNADASLDAWGDLELTAFDGEGWFGLQGKVTMVGNVPADLSSGVLDLGRFDQTASGNHVSQLAVDGNVNLGAMKLQGESTYDLFMDRLDVTGTLDLTSASLTSDSFGYYDTSFNTDHFVIATYGNRIGEFAPGTVTFLATQDHQMLGFFEAGVVYTTGENMGPGEVWLIVPEPGLVSSLAILIPLTLRRRK